MFIFFFFFKQKTAYEMRISDWSSDVCSSDLRAGGAIALKLVVLDEIDTRIEQPRHLCGSRLGIEPDARLDDRADHRATVDARQRPRACDAELRALVAIEAHPRRLETEQPEHGAGLQFGKIDRNRREQLGAEGPVTMEPPQKHPPPGRTPSGP